MKTLRIFVLAVLAATLLAGCRPGPGAEGFVSRDADGLITLAVGRAVDLKEPLTDWRLTDDLEEIGAILPGDDPRAFMTTYSFSYCDDRSIIARSDDRVIRLSLRDGSFLCSYGFLGRGPGEFTQPIRAFAQDGEVFVSDLNSVCHVYSLESGAWLRDIPLAESEGILLNLYAPLGGGLGVLSYSSLNGKPQIFDIVDEAGRVVRQGTVPSNNEKSSISAIRVFIPTRSGGSLCVQSSQADTLYRISASKDTPWIYPDATPYHSPFRGNDYETDERSLLSSISVCGRFAFVQISATAGSGMAVYDLEGGRLVFRAFSPDAEETPQEAGIPYEREGRTLSLFPYFADQDLLICRDLTGEDDYYCFRLK